MGLVAHDIVAGALTSRTRDVDKAAAGTTTPQQPIFNNLQQALDCEDEALGRAHVMAYWVTNHIVAFPGPAEILMHHQVMSAVRTFMGKLRLTTLKTTRSVCKQLAAHSSESIVC